MNADGTAPEAGHISFLAFITKQPQELLDRTSVGCGYEAPYWIVSVGNFPTAWQPGDTLCVEISNTANGQVGQIRVLMTAAGSDQAPDVQLGILLPDIKVSGNGLAIANQDLTPSIQDATDFDSVQTLLASKEYTFTIKNMGTGQLELKGVPLVSINGSGAEDFAVIKEPLAVIASHDSSDFTIRFAPRSIGVRSVTVTLYSNDADENPYEFGVCGTGWSQPSGTAMQQGEHPLAFNLLQNYPNPFNSSTTIVYQLPQRLHVQLSVFDLTGRELVCLMDQEQNSGTFSAVLDKANLASGIYWYRFKAGAFETVRWMTLVR